MLASAVIVPLVLLVIVLTASSYESWKAYRERNRLPLPPPRRAPRARLTRIVRRALAARAARARRRASGGTSAKAPR